MSRIRSTDGYSLIELLVVLIIIGIIAAVAIRSLGTVNESARAEQTKQELDRLADAIAGDRNLVSGGVRTDYGYVGDIGAMPPSLDALINNPGSYTTWRGPYIKDRFTQGGADTYFKQDAWGKAYVYAGGATIASTGGGSTLTREIANSITDLLYNAVTLVVTDLGGIPPGPVYKDSVQLSLSYPDGAGGLTTSVGYPGADGYYRLDSIPIGIHDLLTIYLPTNDTLRRRINVDPKKGFAGSIQLAIDFAGSGGFSGSPSGSIVYVAGTATTTGGNCNKITFDIKNTSGSPLTITSMTPSWSSPTAFYDETKWQGNEVFEQNNPRAGPGDLATFDNSKTIGAGNTVTIQMEGFESSASGGSKVDMSNTDITVTFSDGSVVVFNTGNCN